MNPPPTDGIADAIRSFAGNLAVLAEAADDSDCPEVAAYYRALLALNEAAIASGIEDVKLITLIANRMNHLLWSEEDRELGLMIERLTGLPGRFRAEEN